MQRDEPTKVLNVRVNDDILAWLDGQVQKGFYKSRSEAVRAFLREMVKE